MKTKASSIPLIWNKRISFLTGALVLAGGLLMCPQIGFAVDAQDDAAFTCASAVNVMDCIKATSTGAPPQPIEATELPVNSQLLGFTGPITAGIRYDNYLAWIMDVGYTQGFGNAAAAINLSAGLNERRANVSLGYAITPKQQIKLTYEYLSQNLPFDFASGTVNEWVNQNAFGAAYRYIIGHDFLQDIEVYGTYTKAGSKDLSEVEMYTDNVLTDINYRRIAGGTEMTAGGTVTLTPFKGTLLKLGAGYSTLSFNTEWEDQEKTAALVYNAELSHLLTPTTLISTGIGNTASGRTHTAKVSQILPWSLEGSLVGQYMATTNDIPSSTSVTASLSYPAPKTYENKFTASLGTIKDWVSKPVIYHTRVLAKAEERVVAVQITTNPIPAANISVGTTLNPPIQTKDYFNFNQEVFDKINYSILSVTQKGTQNLYSAATLGLQIVPVDNFNATLSSSTPVSNAAINPGNYTVTLQASGYRSGAVVSQINNPVNMTVLTNTNLGAPGWQPDASLPPASANANTYTAVLTPLVKNNSGVPDESYTFTLTNNPSWLTLGGANKQDLVLVAGTTVPSGLNQASVDLNATSNASGETTGAQKFVITISGTPIGPVWIPSQDQVSLMYPQSSVYQVNVLNSQYVTVQQPASVNSAQVITNLPSLAIQGLDPSNQYVLINPPSINDVGNKGTFTVTATDQNGQTTGTFTVNIIPSTLTQLNPPAWTDNPSTPLPNAQVNQDYSTQNIYLNPYQNTQYPQYVNETTTNSSQSTQVDDILTSFKNDASNYKDNDPCKWIGVDTNSGKLSGTPKEGDLNCYLYVKFHSTALGSDVSLAPRLIQVPSLAPVWSSDLTGSTTYLSNATTTTPYEFQFQISPSTFVTGNPVIGDIDVTDNLSGAIENKVVEQQSKYYVPIKTNIIDSVYSTDNPVVGHFTVVATQDTTSSTSGVFNFTIQPNTSLTPPNWKGGVTLPAFQPTKNYNTNVNPYTTVPNDGSIYISKTQMNGTDVQDQLKFALAGGGSCSGLTISTAGVITGQVSDTSVNYCTFNFTAASRGQGSISNFTQNIWQFIPDWIVPPGDATYGLSYSIDLTKSIKSNIPVDPNPLPPPYQYSIAPQQCSDWLKPDSTSNPTMLSGTPPYGSPTTCNITITAYSPTAKYNKALAAYTMGVTNPGFKAEWKSGQGLPSTTVPYVGTGSNPYPLLLTTAGGSTNDWIQSSITSDSLTLRQDSDTSKWNCSWLTINQNKLTINEQTAQSTTNALNTCDLSVFATSSIAQQEVQVTPTTGVQVTVDTRRPIWNTSLSTNAPQTANVPYMSGNQYKLYLYAPNTSTQVNLTPYQGIGQLTIDNVTNNNGLSTDTLPTSAANDSTGWYVIINSNNFADLNKTGAGTFSADAYGSQPYYDSFIKSTGTTTVNIVPNPDGLNGAAYKTGSNFSATYGVPFTQNINPYTNGSQWDTGNDTWVSYTNLKASPTTKVQDTLTFTSNLQDTSTPCSWLTLSTQGVLSGTNIGQPNCTFTITVASAATGQKTGPYNATVGMIGGPPTCQSASTNMAYDLTQTTQKNINGTSALKLNTTDICTSTTSGLKIQLDRSTQSYDNWQVLKDTNGDYYLVRNTVNGNQYIASDIGDESDLPQQVYIAATNDSGIWSTPTLINVKVVADPANTQFKWIGPSSITANYNSNNPVTLNIFSPTASNLSSCSNITGTCQTVVGDKFAMNGCNNLSQSCPTNTQMITFPITSYSDPFFGTYYQEMVVNNPSTSTFQMYIRPKIVMGNIGRYSPVTIPGLWSMAGGSTATKNWQIPSFVAIIQGPAKTITSSEFIDKNTFYNVCQAWDTNCKAGYKYQYYSVNTTMSTAYFGAINYNILDFTYTNTKSTTSTVGKVYVCYASTYQVINSYANLTNCMQLAGSNSTVVTSPPPSTYGYFWNGGTKFSFIIESQPYVNGTSDPGVQTTSFSVYPMGYTPSS